MPTIRRPLEPGRVRVNQPWAVIRPGRHATVARYSGGLIQLTVTRSARRWAHRASGGGRALTGTAATASEAKRCAEDAARTIARDASA